MWWDTHFHLDSFEKKGTIPQLVEEAIQADVPRMTAIGGSNEANVLALETARRFPDQITCSVGYDRELAPEWDQDLSQVASLIHENEVVAIGECGIDYFHNCGTKEEQHRLFEANMELALQSGKPLIVHSREAEADTLEMLTTFHESWKHDRPCAVLHCFTGGSSFAQKLADLNIMISFSGILTFKNAAPIREAAEHIPEELLLVETDSPYLAPEPHRGERNRPALVPFVGQTLATLRNKSPEEIAEQTTQNAKRFFGLD